MFASVLVGVDGRKGGRDAIALATQLGGPGAEVALAHIYGAGLMPGRGAALLLATELEESQRLLERERDSTSLDAELLPHAEHCVGRGLHELAERQQSDLLVVGSSRRGLLGRLFIGDNTSDSLNRAPCAVAIAPSGYAAKAHSPSTIGVGCDGSAESELALAAARALAARSGATIKALSVVSLQSIPYGESIPENWPDVAKDLMEGERRRFRGLTDVQGEVSYGEPSEELASFGEQLDLLIVGSRSHGPIGRLFNGSTSNYLARRASCPLLVLPRNATKGVRERGLQRPPSCRGA